MKKININDIIQKHDLGLKRVLKFGSLTDYQYKSEKDNLIGIIVKNGTNLHAFILIKIKGGGFRIFNMRKGFSIPEDAISFIEHQFRWYTEGLGRERMLNFKPNCALFTKNEANKKNTHYLTDGIIRSCLNEGGSNTREKGLYYDFSNDAFFTDMNFQRATSYESLKESLGREPTEEEIEKAKKVPFSEDYVFSNQGEDIFSSIESEFIDNILPKFRENPDLENGEFEIEDVKLARLFFLIQIWRTAVCEPQFEIDEELLEKMRNQILNHEELNIEELKELPISITYLKTEGKKRGEEFTKNLVGFMTQDNPKVIFFNDFLIQSYPDNDNIIFNDLYGINNEENFEDFINYQEDNFSINVLSNQDRLKFLETLTRTEKVGQTHEFYMEVFTESWEKIFRESPSQNIKKEFFKELFDYDDLPDAQKMSIERVKKVMSEFIRRKYRERRR